MDGNRVTLKIKPIAAPITTVLAISLYAGISPKLIPAIPTAVVKLVKNIGEKLIFKLSIIASFFVIPSVMFVKAIDSI